MIRRGALTALSLIILSICILPTAKQLPASFLPQEDEGYFFTSLQMPAGSSLQVTEKAGRQIVQELMHMPGINGVVMVGGFNLLTGVQSPNNAFFFVDLKPWSQRNPSTENAAALAASLQKKMNALPSGGLGFAITPPPIPGIGASSDITLMLEDRTGRGVEYLGEMTDTFIHALQQCPEIAAVQNLMANNTPQYYLRFDADKAITQGVAPETAYTTLQVFLGSQMLNYFNLYGYQYSVYMQADAPARMNIEQLNNFYLPGAQGSQVPLNALVNVQKRTGPAFLIRHNMYNAAMLNISAAPGFSGAQVMDAISRTFRESMPGDIGYDYSGMSYQEARSRSQIGLGSIFALSAIFAYLLLASLYESWVLPISVILSVPVAIAGALATLLLAGMQLNLYAEIGLIMLIGLAAKNAILVVEFAQNRLHDGMSLLQATLAGARMRLRPILMTSFAFILGCVPLALASGAGAVARQTVGICVIGGMLAATCIGIFFIPFAYYYIARLRTVSPP